MQPNLHVGTLPYMARLLRFVTLAMIAMTILMPVLECFDRWDGPGVSNDTELPLFLITLFLSLVLILAAVIARRAISDQNTRSETQIIYEPLRSLLRSWTDLPVSPAVSPPLRI